jgi:hypothetical protein
MKGTIIENILVKKGKQVIKNWKHNGYAVNIVDLEKVRGVKLYTEYDGVLYADRHLFYKHGIENNYNGEQQLVLPTKHWEILEVIK